MTLRRQLARSRAAAAGLLAAMVLGCGAPAPKPADSTVAKETLNQALEAWKKGQPADSLKDGNPPVVVSDHRWRGGYTLDRYDIEKDERMHGSDLKVRVTLWQRDPKGKEVKESTLYAVGTGSPFTVVRENDF
jgi:hypothetical protein